MGKTKIEPYEARVNRETDERQTCECAGEAESHCRNVATGLATDGVGRLRVCDDERHRAMARTLLREMRRAREGGIVGIRRR